MNVLSHMILPKKQFFLSLASLSLLIFIGVGIFVVKAQAEGTVICKDSSGANVTPLSPSRCPAIPNIQVTCPSNKTLHLIYTPSPDYYACLTAEEVTAWNTNALACYNEHNEFYGAFDVAAPSGQMTTKGCGVVNHKSGCPPIVNGKLTLGESAPTVTPTAGCMTTLDPGFAKTPQIKCQTVRGLEYWVQIADYHGTSTGKTCYGSDTPVACFPFGYALTAGKCVSLTPQSTTTPIPHSDSITCQNLRDQYISIAQADQSLLSSLTGQNIIQYLNSYCGGLPTVSSPAPQSQPTPALTLTPALELKPELKPEPKPELKPEPKPEPESTSVPEPTPKTKRSSPFKNEAECKRYYQKVKNLFKKKKLEYEDIALDEKSSELGIFIDEYLEISGQLINKDLKVILCDRATYNVIVKKTEELEDLSISIDEELLDLQEKAKRAAPELDPEIVKYAESKGFSEKALRHSAVQGILSACFSYPWFAEISDKLQTNIESIQYVSERFQNELIETKGALCSKINETIKTLSKGEQKELLETFVMFLKTHWDAAVIPSITKKFDQLPLDVKRGVGISRLTQDLQALYTQRVADNNFELYQKGVMKFCDVNNAEWYSSILQDPKQTAFKGSGCSVFPTHPLKAGEALVALVRSLQIPVPEEGAASLPLEVKDTPPWAVPSVFAAIELAGVTPLRLDTILMSESVSREIFALWIWQLSQKEELANKALEKPTRSDIKAVEKDFDDLQKLKNDPDIMEAIAFVRKNGFMTGKKSNEFGTGSLLRAEGAKILLVLSQKLTK